MNKIMVVKHKLYEEKSGNKLTKILSDIRANDTKSLNLRMI